MYFVYSIQCEIYFQVTERYNSIAAITVQPFHLFIRYHLLKRLSVEVYKLLTDYQLSFLTPIYGKQTAFKSAYQEFLHLSHLMFDDHFLTQTATIFYKTIHLQREMANVICQTIDSTPIVLNILIQPTQPSERSFFRVSRDNMSKKRSFILWVYQSTSAISSHIQS